MCKSGWKPRGYWLPHFMSMYQVKPRPRCARASPAVRSPSAQTQPRLCQVIEVPASELSTGGKRQEGAGAVETIEGKGRGITTT